MNRKLLATLTLTALLPVCIADAAPRKVLCENFTATWCTTCPDMANGIIQLMNEFPDTCFAMQIHKWDSYSTNWGGSRWSFYNVPGPPTVWLDGSLNLTGSQGSVAANYKSLRSKYIQLSATSTDVTIDVCGETISANTYTVTSEIAIESAGVGKTMKIHCAQMLHNYPANPTFNYGCFKQQSLQTITLAPGEVQQLTFNFTLDSSSQSNTGNVYFLVWAQETNNSGPSEVFQVEKHTHGTTPCLPACPADVSGDGVVNVTDLLAVIEAWGSANVNADINTDGLVDVSDLLELVSNWGAC